MTTGRPTILGQIPFADYADARPDVLPLDDCGNACDGPNGHAEGCPDHCHCYDGNAEPCAGCNAEEGEECRPWCLGRTDGAS